MEVLTLDTYSHVLVAAWGRVGVSPTPAVPTSCEDLLVMKLRDFAVVLAGIAAIAVTVSCQSEGGGSPDTQRPLVEKAAGIAFGPPVHCPERDKYGSYLCGAVTCSVTLGVTTRDGDTADFYDCEFAQPGCTSVTGGCSSDEKCVVGHGKSMAVDYLRTGGLPGNGGGLEFSCPYHDEG